jgi:hypothetical protein
MGAKDTMQNFFMGMAGQMASGYGAKTVSTPMGPFKWDDNIQMWVNTNNGVVMSNISFQDQYAMIDYGTSDGSGLQGDPVSVTISPTSWGNFTAGNAGTDVWASAAGPVALVADATPVTFTINSFAGALNSINVSLSVEIVGTGSATLIYAKNALSEAPYTTPITMVTGDTLKVGLTVAALSNATAIITVKNAANESVIGTVSGSFS